MDDRRRALPSVDALLRDPAIVALLQAAPRNAVVGAVRESLRRARAGRAGPPEDWASDITELLAQQVARSLNPVINATGIVLHTNLGRAPLATAAVEALAAIAGAYSALEYDLHLGTRGSRADHCRHQLAGLSGSADALVVNNAAGALVVALNACAEGKDVIISRGELIEIGGSFRIPDILLKSGARLREVGTTNRTTIEDYRKATGPGTGAILIVHRSNFEQTGFVTTPDPRALAALAHEAGIPCIHDIGSGLLLDLSPWGLQGEPRVPDAIANGADLVIFSGDKLLGGPQAGCMVGSARAVDDCRRNPLARAFRADKLTLAALEATLALYLDPEIARREVPVLAMLTMPETLIAERATRMAAQVRPPLAASVIAGVSAVGGGAFPGSGLPTALLSIEAGSTGPHTLALRLRLGDPALIARVEGQRVLLDLRTVAARDDTTVLAALAGAATALEQG